MALRAALEMRFSGNKSDLEVTELFGGIYAIALKEIDARDLTDLAQAQKCGYSVSTGFSAAEVQVTFDPTASWETPMPFHGPYWPGDVVSALTGDVGATELCRKAAGSTRVVRFTGTTNIPGRVVDRIMASPHVVDVRFKPSAFDVMLARESPTLGGLSHLVATKKICRRRSRRREQLGDAVAAHAMAALTSQGKPSDQG